MHEANVAQRWSHKLCIKATLLQSARAEFGSWTMFCTWIFYQNGGKLGIMSLSFLNISNALSPKVVVWKISALTMVSSCHSHMYRYQKSALNINISPLWVWNPPDTIKSFLPPNSKMKTLPLVQSPRRKIFVQGCSNCVHYWNANETILHVGLKLHRRSVSFLMTLKNLEHVHAIVSWACLYSWLNILWMSRLCFFNPFKAS